MNRVLQYERNDLTVSVEAGMPFAELQAMLGREGQAIGIDPPYTHTATVGGVVATDLMTRWQRRFGRVRDAVIGMSVATLEGKLVQSGGMVVKNVAGLDMAKLFIGSFGTLGLITSVNFRVQAMSEATRLFTFSSNDLSNSLDWCTRVLTGPLRPLAIDVLNPALANDLGLTGYTVLVQASGSERILQRFAQELPGAEIVTREAETALTGQLREFGPEWIDGDSQRLVVKIHGGLGAAQALLMGSSGPVWVQAGCDAVFLYLRSGDELAGTFEQCHKLKVAASVQAAPQLLRETRPLCWEPQHLGLPQAFDTMKRVKGLFDPQGLLNARRLYGRL